MYEGEFHEGWHQGFGTLTYPNGAKYTGEWRFNLFHGNGELIYSNGDKFTGQFREGKRNGRGSLWTKITKTVQEGTWRNDIQEGQGVYKWPSGIQWSGLWQTDEAKGYGRYNDRNQSTPERCARGKFEQYPDLFWLKANL